jgi:hypothetical protein
MKKVNSAIAGIIMRRHVGEAGKNNFFSAPKGPRPEGAEVAVMPAS